MLREVAKTRNAAWGGRGVCYQVRVHWANWTTRRQRSTRLHEIEVSRVRLRARSRRPGCSCVGTQSSDDPTLIEVDDHRLICGLVGAMVYPR